MGGRRQPGVDQGGGGACSPVRTQGASFCRRLRRGLLVRGAKSGERSMTQSRWKVDVLLAGSWRGATSVLLSDARRHVIVDTGMPNESHQLVAALERRGLRPDDISITINTHFHIDHVSN